MNLTADYHTHTVFSHGKGSIMDNALAAKERGLKELGISDHGFAHPVFGLSGRKLPEIRKLTDMAKAETGVNVLLGIESNIIGTDGTVDLKSERFDYFDIFLAGVHKFVKYKPLSFFSLFVPNFFNSAFNVKKVPKRLVRRNTEAYKNVIKNNPIDVITHLNFCCYSDAAEVAKVAADYGTYIELNSKKTHLSDDELYEVLKTDVKFVIDSDAHTPDRVGEIALVEELVKRVNFPVERIMNIDGRLPDFRFARFKGRAGA